MTLTRAGNRRTDRFSRAIFVLAPLILAATVGRPQAQQGQQLPFRSEIEAFEAADKAAPPPQGAVLFIGSSSIRLWKSLAADFPEITVINRGFGGSTIADSVRYADRIAIPYKPGMIVMYAGGNDIHASKSPEQVLADFQQFVSTIHAALPNTRIVYVSINPSVARWNEEERELTANGLIKEFIRKNNRKTAAMAYLDSHSKLLSREGKPRPEILRTDGLHLNDEGYRLWLKVLKKDILRLARTSGVEVRQQH